MSLLTFLSDNLNLMGCFFWKEMTDWQKNSWRILVLSRIIRKFATAIKTL